MMISNPSIGSLVVTNDGKELGRVKETAGSCFKVDAPMQADYWLATDAIKDVAEGPVVLRLNSADLNEAKMDAPGAEHKGWHRHKN